MTAIGVKAALNQSTEEFRERFDHLDKMLATIASDVVGFSELALALRPQSKLSEQAASIVTQLVESGAEKFMWVTVLSGEPDDLQLIGGKTRRIEYSEPRFLKDDLATIEGLGLVRVTFGSRGTPNYHVTRAAVDFVKARSGGAPRPGRRSTGGAIVPP